MQVIASASEARRRALFWRLTILAHRYVGIAVGVLVLAWCTSGVIMMYVPYPALTAGDQLVALDPLELAVCCAAPQRHSDRALRVRSYVVESAADKLVLRAQLANGEMRVLDLQSGKWLTQWTPAALTGIGRDYATRRNWSPPGPPVTIERDQWTVHARFNAHRPLLKFTNSEGREWYVSSRSAEIVQVTGARERFWNWPGAVTHWLYPTRLRQHTALWAQIVIWSTLVGLFLTLTGIVIGIRQYRWRDRKRRSPYRGWALWHHYAGLAFGLLTLLWLASGLLSMNPWGALEGRDFSAQRARLNDVDAPLGDVIASLGRSKGHVPPDIVRITARYWRGSAFFALHGATGKPVRVSSQGSAPAPSATQIRDAALELQPGFLAMDLLQREDAYYYNHHKKREFPVHRLTYDNGERFYLSAATGQLLEAVDENRRWYRWLFNALHQGDFHPFVRLRPLWDLLMLLALSGVSIGVATGVYLGFRRMTR